MKKVLSFLLSLTLILSVLMLGSCKKDGDDAGKDEKKTAYVSLDINPSLELVTDENGTVVAVRGANEDGQILLYSEEIKGMDISAAVEKITQLSVDMGYLNPDNTTVGVTVSSGNADYAAEITDKVNTTVTATAQKSGLTVKTDASGAYSLLRRLEQFKAEHPDNEAIQSLTPAKFKMALSVSETGDVTLEVAVEMDDEALIEKIKEADSTLEEYATRAYLAAKNAALVTYDIAAGMDIYRAYTDFYTQNALAHPTTCYYGAAYRMYATAADLLRVIDRAAKYKADADATPLTEEQIAAVKAALNLTDEELDLLRDENGNITVDSIEAYADKYFKNSPAGEDLAAKKAALNEALNRAEAEIRAAVEALSEEYKEQIDATLAASDAILAAVKSYAALVPGLDLDECINDYIELTARIREWLAGDRQTIADLDDFIAAYQAKADKYLHKIEADLSADELAEIETRKSVIEAFHARQRAALDEALTKAGEKARAFLEGRKAALLQPKA